MGNTSSSKGIQVTQPNNVTSETSNNITSEILNNVTSDTSNNVTNETPSAVSTNTLLMDTSCTNMPLTNETIKSSYENMVETVNELSPTVTETKTLTSEIPKESDEVQITSDVKIEQQKFIHPFIDMINKNCSPAEMINILQAFCGNIQVGKDDKGNTIFETVDQTEFLTAVLQVFCHCATYGKKSVVEWLMKEYIPLQVSYDNNYCYFECLKWDQYDIADMLVEHESFVPSMEVLENLLFRQKYEKFKKCMDSPNLPEEVRIYRFTLMHYIDEHQYYNARHLFYSIQKRMKGEKIHIEDWIYPNQKLSQLQNKTAGIEHLTDSNAMEQINNKTEIIYSNDHNDSNIQSTQTNSVQIEWDIKITTDDIVIDMEQETTGQNCEVEEIEQEVIDQTEQNYDDEEMEQEIIDQTEQNFEVDKTEQ